MLKIKYKLCGFFTYVEYYAKFLSPINYIFFQLFCKLKAKYCLYMKYLNYLNYLLIKYVIKLKRIVFNFMLFQGLLIPCISVLISNWCPKTERGFLYSIIHSAHPLGPVLGNIFAGYVSESPRGWPYVFYSLGNF